MQGCAAECTILLPYPPPYTPPPIVRIPYRTIPPSSTYWPYRATLGSTWVDRVPYARVYRPPLQATSDFDPQSWGDYHSRSDP
eukprot:360219-Chlamydomonas_euryale.AAC.4